MPGPISDFIKTLWDTREQAEDEAYQYFNDNIRPLPTTPDGKWDIDSGKFSNNDVDAFRHAYVSGVYTQKYNEIAANLLGQFNELLGDLIKQQPPEQKNMDLWNNELGRSYGSSTTSKKDLADALKKELEQGGLITTTNQKEDERAYQGYLIKPVKVIEESETGRNIKFLDMSTNFTMSREEFVGKINSGEYPGYTVVLINNIETPISKPDENRGNNLG